MFGNCKCLFDPQYITMMKGRAPGVDEIHVEMLMVGGGEGINWKKRLLNTCMRQGKVPEEWRTGLIVPI